MSKPQQQYPNWLYQAIPVLYLSAGALAMATVPSTMMLLIGLIFLSVGLLVLALRYLYRRPFNASSGYINVPDWSQIDAPKDGHFQISWRSNLDSKNPVLSAKNRRLFGLGNELVNAVLLKKSKPDMELLFKKFVDHMADCFQDQEAVMARAKAPYFAGHKREHQALLTKAQDRIRRFHDDDLTARELLDFVTFNVIVEHLLKEEFKFVARGMKPRERRIFAREDERDQRRSAAYP